jgi:uncharacterized membrane protein YeaQ/YmgE (transglycosylase-associated protein family)
MAIIWFIVFGLVVGALARLFMPGPQPMGIIMTALLGMAGSFVGGFLGKLFHGENVPLTEPTTAGWIGSIIGAFLLLLLYGFLRKKA